jgi:hypothetical protein
MEQAAARKPNWAFRVRVSILIAVLLMVAGYAARDVYVRRARTDWERTLLVAVVVLEVEPVDASALASFSERLPLLQEKLALEARRFRPELGLPFEFQLFGPIEVKTPPPVPSGDSFFELGAHAYRQWRYLESIDAHAGVASRAYDGRLYVTVRPPRQGGKTLVEGFSQHGGRIGSVSVELDDQMVDLALLVVAHELLHTLGASDKYDATGHVIVPHGLADPMLEPLYPQTHVEIMARNRPLAPGKEVVPESLDELRIGSRTAIEIGWLASE